MSKTSIEKCRHDIMVETLKLLSDKWIKVHGQRLQIRIEAPDDAGDVAEFHIVAEEQYGSNYLYQIQLIAT